MENNITIVNYGMGNVGSVANMFKRIGYTTNIASTSSEILQASKLLLPGVGAFGNAMALIDEKNLRSAILQKVQQEQVPILGICLGMQLLTNGSQESAESKGLGLIDAQTLKFDLQDTTLKIPHMGWNFIHASKQHSLLENLPSNPKYYFVHSYFVQCNNPQDVLATCHYEKPFTCMVQKGNVLGAQFHPEKSHKFGMHLLENFAKL
jgi:imidazole glycerol-phosphate synthase subunit HisH